MWLDDRHISTSLTTIALEAEGFAIEFRNLKLKELP